MKNFNSLATEITIEFDCINCGSKIIETISDLPIANMNANYTADSENYTEDTFTCPDCDNEYTYEVYVNMNEGKINIQDENDNIIQDFDIEECFNDIDDEEW